MNKNTTKRKLGSPITIAVVVLIAIILISVAGYTVLSKRNELDGSLEFKADISEITFNEGGQAFAYFDITMDRPSSVRAQDVFITVKNQNGDTVLDEVYWTGHPSVQWSNRDSQNRVRTRSRLELLIHNSWNNVEGEGIRHYEVIVRIEGYNGTMRCRIE